MIVMAEPPCYYCNVVAMATMVGGSTQLLGVYSWLFYCT